jgi:hypothetical protein
MFSRKFSCQEKSMPSPLWPFYTEVTADAVSVAVVPVTLAGYASPDPASRPFFGPDREVTAEGGIIASGHRSYEGDSRK